MEQVHFQYKGLSSCNDPASRTVGNFIFVFDIYIIKLDQKISHIMPSYFIYFIDIFRILWRNKRLAVSALSLFFNCILTVNLHIIVGIVTFTVSFSSGLT